MATIEKLLVIMCCACMQIGQATVTTDLLADKLSSLEQRLHSLEQKNTALETQNQALQRQLEALRAINASLLQTVGNLTAETLQCSDRVKTQLLALHSQERALTHDLDVLKSRHANDSQGCSSNTTRPHVSFHVRMTPSKDDSTPAPNTPVIMTDVLNNEHNAYDPATGKFTAPFTGTYCVLGSTEPAKGGYAGVFLMVDGHSVDFMEVSSSSSHRAMSVNMVVRLNAGQRVWMKSNHHSHFWAPPTSFSGFLIYAQ